MVFDLIIEAFKLKVIIGILDFEKQIPQEVLIEGKITYKYSREDFVDYIEVKNIIQKLLQTNQYGLLEDALLDITHHLKNKFNTIKNIELKIKKLNIDPDCIVGVKINKSF